MRTGLDIDFNFANVFGKLVQCQQSDIQMVSSPISQLASRVFIEPPVVSMRPAKRETGTPAVGISNAVGAAICLLWRLALPKIPV